MWGRQQPRYKQGDVIGRRFHVYEVLMGGMGEVYLCVDRQTDTPYALKTFQKRYTTSGLEAALFDEVQIWVELDKHAHIVHCSGLDVIDSIPFIILDWVPGNPQNDASLRRQIHDGKLTPQSALQIMVDVCGGLVHAQHQQRGIVHRDLKPENILVTPDQIAKITDFGLAAVIHRAKIQTDNSHPEGHYPSMRQGQVVGTPHYMPPEQWDGRSDLDPRADFYAVGCILYELLTGTQPFSPPRHIRTQGQWMAHLKNAHQNEPPPPLSDRTPVSLRSIISRCLEKHPSQRFADAQSLQDALTDAYVEIFHQAPRTISTDHMLAIDYNNRGLTYMTLDMSDKALENYDRAIAIDKALPQVYTNRGMTYVKMNRLAEAISDLNQAIHLNPSSAAAYNNRGVVYSQNGTHEAALADFTQASEIDPNFSEAYFNRATLFAKADNMRAALVDFEMAASLNNARAHEAVGLIRKMLQLPDLGQANPAVAAVEAFQSAQTFADMQQVVHNHPLIQSPQVLKDFQTAVEKNKSDPTTQLLRERLRWLQQILNRRD